MHPMMEELTMKKINRTIENLRRNRMEAVYAKDRAEARELLKSYLIPGCSIGCGGSVTLDEIDALSLFRCGDYRFFDRYAEGLSADEVKAVYHDALNADVYVMSSNAVTENGELYNVDGRGNRVAALIYGPERVVVVVGCNKIVNNINDAILRVKTVSAPANAARLHCKTPCAHTGRCISLDKQHTPELCEGCETEARICASYVVSGYQREANRIKVIIVGESLGF